MVVARTPEAREGLKAQFQAHSIERAYEAIVVGEAEARTCATLHGRHPRDRLRFTTRVRRGSVRSRTCASWAPSAARRTSECTLETGRTHQIRVHLAEGGTPVLGDPALRQAPRDSRVRDGRRERLGHQALTRGSSASCIPGSGQRVRFEAPPPRTSRGALVKR